MNASRIYKKLLAHFGKQGWWPVFDIKKGGCVYHRPHNNRLEVCIGAILTQNTAWKNVEKALYNLVNCSCMNAEKIKNCKNLEELIAPAGYYNQKAKKLRIFADWWLSSSPVIPAKAGISYLREELLSLWGIGPETADSMLLYAFGEPIFVIDTYTKRLCKEFGVGFKKYDEYREFFESQLPRDPQIFNEYHALIVAWGKLYARDKVGALEIIK